MNLIVAVDQNWGIGYNNDLLVKIPDDLKRFRLLTSGKTIVMGRKTFESLPNQKPLANRRNIVLSKDKNLKIENVQVINSIHEINQGNDVFVIGGREIYKQLLPYCEKAYITKIQHTFDADTYFPNLNTLNNWKVVEGSNIYECLCNDKPIKYQYLMYKNNNA